jgi:SRSO17 transposase
MKPSQHSTCKPPHTIARTDRHLAAALVPVARAVASVLCSPRTFQHAQLSLQAILSEIPRKNGWQIAEQARLPQPYAIQRLLSRATCDQDGVRDELRSFVGQVLTTPPAHLAAGSETAPPFPVLVLGESGFPKRGSHFAGVGMQFCGRTGRVENCQVGVFLSYVTAAGHALIDRELYLPADRCADLPRRQVAHIPDSVTFATKPELAQRMVQRAQAADLPIRWVVANSVYGHSPDLRQWLHEQGCAYAMAVPSTEVIAVQTPAGLLLSAVGNIAHHLPGRRDWQRLSQSEGSKGDRLFDWAILPWLQAGCKDGRHFLVIPRCLDDPSTLTFYLVFAPLATELSTIVQAIGARWRIEEDLEAAKDLGLAHYEVRSSLGWYVCYLE